jgi:hypothetical protein
MRIGISRWFIIIILLFNSLSAYSQENVKNNITVATLQDSLRKKGVFLGEKQKNQEITLSKRQALKYLHEQLRPQLWNNSADPLRQAFNQLIYEASHPSIDSVREILLKYPYDSLSIPWDKFFIWEPLRMKIPVLSKPEFKMAVDSTNKSDSAKISLANDSLNLLTSQNVKRLDITEVPSGLKDTTFLVIVDTLTEVKSIYSGSPFRYFNSPFQSDSIKAAVITLINSLDERDSTLISFTGVGKSTTSIMMNSKSTEAIRFWLKNETSDSVTVWIGNPSRNTFGLYLEQGVYFRRPVKQRNYSEAKVNVQKLDNSKLMLQRIMIKPKHWKYHSEAAYVLNQSALTNWVRGGENSYATALDVTGYANYNNPDIKLSSSNFARIKFGYQKSGKEDIRKNLDLFETNSKLNHKAFGKFDFSAILLFKTQLARGYNYSDTSLVSKFMNPAILTVGFGLDYKPNKTTSLNFSPLSYKGTFVTCPAYYDDTYYPARIDQTKYGVAKNRKSLNEPGVSFMITNEFKPVETITLVNRLQLFTNYIHNPQNVDVDWEMIATVHINWFTDVRFNTHLIFDDDTKTDEVYKNGSPVLRADGTQKKTARIQFKEMLGFSLSFRF